MPRSLFLLCVLSLACRNDDKGGSDTAPTDSGTDDTGVIDGDGDGSPAGEDCDDADASVHPGAEETPYDGVDNDCDDATLDDDLDGDGFLQAEDCDDTDAAVSPDATEVCDEVDDDCDGAIDEDVTGTWYADADGDGYGDLATAVASCEAPSGTVADATDCDDTDPSVNPGATEVCNEVDDDCDGGADDADPDGVPGDAATWYADADGDGYGDAATTAVSCQEPTDHVVDATDCDDGDSDIFPGAEERCDGLDDDCDGLDDTLGYWPFDEGSGTVAGDAGGAGLDGTIVNATWTTGYSGDALAFDGASAYVELDYTELEAAHGVTLSAWVSPDSLRSSSWDSIISRGASGSASLGCCGDSYYIGYYRTAMSFYTNTTSTVTGMIDSGTYTSHVGGWHHVLATWDADSGERVIYVDGVPTTSDFDGPAVPYYDGTPTLVGADTNSGAFTLPFDGLIDEVKIFDCAVDATQAATDYSANWPF